MGPTRHHLCMIVKVQHDRTLHPRRTRYVTAPRTIREAMDLTHQLKFRYLWVNALCIVQEPPGFDEHQVRAMHAIYHFSEITIVAAAGSDANTGLPGFGAHSRPAATQDRTREPDKLDRDWFRPSFRTVIPASTWSSRGWTLQEQLLSVRCLFITKHQIYFKCRCSTIEEEYGLCFEQGNDTHHSDAPLFTNLLYNHRWMTSFGCKRRLPHFLRENLLIQLTCWTPLQVVSKIRSKSLHPFCRI